MKGFVDISRFSGMREDLVQAGGGNSSFKMSVDRMVIKSSGVQLADITMDNGYSIVNPQIIQNRFLNCRNLEQMTDEESKSIILESYISGKRPSIETFLHAVSGKYTLHTHPVVVNILACRKGGMEELRELFPKALIVKYATPGVELAKEYFKAYKENAIKNSSYFEIVFLQNHGVIISGKSAEDVINTTEYVTRKIEEYLNLDMDAYHNLTRVWSLMPEKIVWRVTDYNVIRAYEILGSWDTAICPDCVVFLGKRFLKLSSALSIKEIDDFKRTYGTPVVLEFEGCLYIVANSVKNAMEIQSIMSLNAQVMMANKGMTCNLLSDKEQNTLLNWDAEKYRKELK